MSARPRWAWALPSNPVTLLHDLRAVGGAGSACWPATPQPSGGAPAGAPKSPHRDSCRTRSWAPHLRRPPDRSPSCPPPSAQSQGADSPGHGLLGRAQAVWDEGGDCAGRAGAGARPGDGTPRHPRAAAPVTPAVSGAEAAWTDPSPSSTPRCKEGVLEEERGHRSGPRLRHGDDASSCKQMSQQKP